MLMMNCIVSFFLIYTSMRFGLFISYESVAIKYIFVPYSVEIFNSNGLIAPGAKIRKSLIKS